MSIEQVQSKAREQARCGPEVQEYYQTVLKNSLRQNQRQTGYISSNSITYLQVENKPLIKQQQTLSSFKPRSSIQLAKIPAKSLTQTTEDSNYPLSSNKALFEGQLENIREISRELEHGGDVNLLMTFIQQYILHKLPSMKSLNTKEAQARVRKQTRYDPLLYLVVKLLQMYSLIAKFTQLKKNHHVKPQKNYGVIFLGLFILQDELVSRGNPKKGAIDWIFNYMLENLDATLQSKYGHIEQVYLMTKEKNLMDLQTMKRILQYGTYQQSEIQSEINRLYKTQFNYKFRSEKRAYNTIIKDIIKHFMSRQNENQQEEFKRILRARTRFSLLSSSSPRSRSSIQFLMTPKKNQTHMTDVQNGLFSSHKNLFDNQLQSIRETSPELKDEGYISHDVSLYLNINIMNDC